MAEHGGSLIRMTFGGDAFANGRVPLTLLAAKLQALQNLLFHTAATVRHDPSARRGQWANRYRDAVELRFTSARPGSLVIEAELPAAGAPRLGEQFDLGRQAIDLAYNFAQTLERAPAQLAVLVPDRQERALLLRSLENLSPDPAEHYYVELGNGSPEHRDGVRLTGQTRLAARMAATEEASAADDVERDQAVVGTLTKIHYDVGPQKIAVRTSAGTEVDCYYDDSLRDQIANLCAGSLVEVTGIASVDAEGRLRQIDSVTGVEIVSMEPIRVSQLEHQGARYRLREPLPLVVEYADGVWSYHNAALNLWGYAARREDALRELGEAFDYIYREIASERDEALDDKAIEIKRRLLDLLEPANAGGV